MCNERRLGYVLAIDIPIHINLNFQIEKRCWLHVGKDATRGKIIIFTEETLAQCLLKKDVRDKTKKRKSKFDGIVLPEKVDGSAGYHSNCYRYFCCITKKDTTAEIDRRQDTESSKDLQKGIPSNTPPNTPLSIAGVILLLTNRLTRCISIANMTTSARRKIKLLINRKKGRDARVNL